MGRQLNEEAARREAASVAARQSQPTLPLSLGSARRARLFGRSHPNADVIQYGETFAQKVHQNTTADTLLLAAKQPHNDPVVTVAVRSDGSVETVTFVRSSGVAAIDEEIRRVVQSLANFQPFSPTLNRDFDVIEIRKTWHFDTAVRLY
jgi:TonB family protein